MSFAFFNRDYILNCGEQNFSGEHFSAVLLLCHQYCNWFSLAVTDETHPVLQELRTFLVPPSKADDEKGKKYFILCKDTIHILEKHFSDFFEFQSNGDELVPEDPVFYRADGSTFLECCAHEGEVFLYPRQQEDVFSILSYGGWIEMVGGSVSNLGCPKAPASEHQLQPEQCWNVQNDSLYILLCDVFHRPEYHLEKPAFSLLYAYISGFQRGWCTPMPAQRPQWAPMGSYTPKWFLGCKLSILARYGKTTDISLPEVYGEAGLSDEAAFMRFFDDMNQYLCQVL